MSGECDKCGEHCLDCKCTQRTLRFERIPLCEPTPEEISKQLRINIDILKKEITDHIDKELERFKNEMDKYQR